MDPQNLFGVAIANGRYFELPSLDRAVTDAQQLSEVLENAHSYRVFVIPDPTQDDLADLSEHTLAPASLTDGALILIWVGHGRIGPDHSLRLLGRSTKRDIEISTPGQLAEWATRTGARQVLLVLDTCYSGGGLLQAAALADAVDKGRISPGTAWFGVLAASLSDEKSASGALVPALARLLQEGPTQSNFAWDRSRPYIQGDVLIQTLLKEWNDPRQQPHQLSAGRAWDLVRNPRFQPGLPDQPVEHLLQASRGSSGDTIYFSGRETVLGTIVNWLAKQEPGLFVLTGSPGCGKSAIAGRIASLSSQGERSRILAQQNVPPELDPGQGSVDVQVHARGLTLSRFAEKLGIQLGLPPNADQLAVLAEASRRRREGRAPVFIIDGLDEAGFAAREIAAELLSELSKQALVLVATREVIRADGSLIADLGPAAVSLNLDDHAESTRAALHTYIHARLNGVHPGMDPEKVAAALLPDDVTTSAPFLLARLVTSQLAENPVDTSSLTWQYSLATSVESALDRDLYSVTLTLNGEPHPPAARELTRALAYAHGGGFPAEDLWPSVATALSPSGAVYNREHAFSLLESLGRHFIASLEQLQPVYRIAHQRLVDYLKITAPGSVADVFPAIASAVSGELHHLLDAGIAQMEHPYLFRYAWRHFADAGPQGIELLRALVARNRPAFLYDLALAVDWQATTVFHRGDLDAALPLAEESVSLFRELNNRREWILGNYFLAHLYLAIGDAEKAGIAAEEAASVARRSAETAQDRELIASALVARAMVKLQEGAFPVALLLAEEAISLCRSDPADMSQDGSSIALASICERAALVASTCGDMNSAVRYAEEALEILNLEESRPLVSTLLVSVLSTLAGLELQLGATTSAAPDGHPTPFRIPSGERLLAEFRNNPTEWGSLELCGIAKGVLFLFKANLANRALGIPIANTSDILATIAQLDALLQPVASSFIDAAGPLAGLLDLRATLTFLEDPDASRRDWEKAEQYLLPFLHNQPTARAQLGEVLSNRNQYLIASETLQGGEMAEALVRQQRSVDLISSTQLPLGLYSLALAHHNLCVLLQLSGASPERLESATSEAIPILRSAASKYPLLQPHLVIMLSDRAAFLLRSNIVEAADLAREAYMLSKSLAPPLDAQFGGMALLNFAGAQLHFGRQEDSRRKYRESICLLESVPGAAPQLTGALAVAHSNLALIEIQVGDPNEALRLARIGADLLNSESFRKFSVVNPHVVPLALGLANKRCGDPVLGDQLTRQVFSTILTGMQQGSATLQDLASLLNAASDPALWSEAKDSLKDQPDLARQLEYMRLWPAEQVLASIDHLQSALRSVSLENLLILRTYAKFQRMRSTDAFDTAWRESTGELPEWLTTDLVQQLRLMAWWGSADSISHLLDYFRTHPALLAASMEILLDEFTSIFGVDQLIEDCRYLVELGRKEGIDRACIRFQAQKQVLAWLSSAGESDPSKEHPEEFLRPEILEELRTMAPPDDRSFMRLMEGLEAAQMLEARGERDLAIRAIRDPSSLLDLLEPALHSRDIPKLSVLASILFGLSEDPAYDRRAALYLGIARLLDQRNEESLTFVRQAATDATSEEHQEFITILGHAITLFPASGPGLARLMAIFLELPKLPPSPPA